MINEAFLVGTANIINDAIQIETNESIIDLLVSIDISKLTSAAFLLEELSTLEFCLNTTNNTVCAELYQTLFLGFKTEIAILQKLK